MNLKDFRAVLFDLDGTIYYGSELIDGAIETVTFFREQGIKVFFGTNNSSKTRENICLKLNNMGIKCSKEEIITSGFLAAIYCQKNNIDNVFISGTKELLEEFKRLGISTNQTDKAKNLVIGFNKDADYQDLTDALRVALQAKKIIACNVERNYPGDYSLLYPSCGGIVKAIEWCSNRECDCVVGKPNPFMVEYLRDNYETAQQILVVGDSIEFDVGFAKNAAAIPILINNNDYSSCITVKSIKDIPKVFK